MHAKNVRSWAWKKIHPPPTWAYFIYTKSFYFNENSRFMTFIKNVCQWDMNKISTPFRAWKDIHSPPWHPPPPHPKFFWPLPVLNSCFLSILDHWPWCCDVDLGKLVWSVLSLYKCQPFENGCSHSVPYKKSSINIFDLDDVNLTLETVIHVNFQFVIANLLSHFSACINANI